MRRRLTRITAVHSDEQGSLLLALLATIVAGGLMTVLVAATITNQRATRFDQSYTQAVHVAELGLNRAVFLLDTGQLTATATPQAVVVDGKTALWTAQETPAGSGVWLLTSEGTQNGVTRRVQVTAQRSRRFPAAIYTEVKMHLTGPKSVSSYDSATGTTNETDNGLLRSGGTLQPTAVTSDPGDPTDSTPECLLYPCANAPLKLANDENMRFITDTLAACATPLTTWQSSTAATPGVLDLTGSGPHCFENLVFDQNTKVVATTDAPLAVYVRNTVEFKNKALVTVHSCASCAETLPRPGAAFQIYSAGPQVLFGKGHRITAAIYAPRADCRGNQTMPDTIIYGSLVCSSLKTNGPFQLIYDDRISMIRGAFALSRWTEL